MSLGSLLQIPAVSDYYFEADFDSAIDEVVSKYHLPPERSDEFLDLIIAILNDAITVPDMPVLIAEAFGVDTLAAKAISVDLIGKTLLPLANYVPGLEQGIVDLGGKLNDFPPLRLSKEVKDFVALVTQRAAQAGVTLDDVLAKRLLFLLGQYAKKEKTEDWLKTFFTRASSIGGLGLKPELATALLQETLPLAPSLLNGLLPATSPASFEQTKSAPQADNYLEQDVIPAPSHEVLVQSTEALQTAAPALVSASVVQEPTVAEVVTSPTSMPISSPVASAIIEAAAAEPTVIHSQVSSDQTSAVATPAHVQSAATLAPLPKPVATARPQAPAPEMNVDKQELKVPAKKAEDAKKIIASVQDGLATAIELATTQARETLKKVKVSEKVFTEVADKVMKGVRDIYQTRDVIERDWKVTGADLAVLMQALTAGIDAYHKALPKASISPVTSPPAPASEQAKMDEKFAHMTQASSGRLVPPAKAELTVGSTNLQSSDGQRKVIDVMNTPRLTGPVEQLGTMTPVEFRRLSSNPSEACQKIEDLLATLEGTSYEERIKGVIAWRESPMNQLYLSLAEEALTQGLALPEVSSRRRAAGQESLSPAEMKALALFNAKIRF